MDKVTRNILIGTGFVAVAGGLYLFFANRKDKGKGGGGLGGILKPKGEEFDMGYTQNAYIHIAGDDRERATDFLKVGTIIEMTGGSKEMNQEHTIAKIWKDVNGNVGAFKTKEFSIGYGGKDRQYEGKGKIFVKTA